MRMSLKVRNGAQNYGPTQPNVSQQDQSTIGGPSPGCIDVPREGKIVDLSALAVPGPCFIQNLDSTYAVEYGIYDPETLRFYPLGEVLQEDVQVLRLSRNIQEEYYGSSSSTTGGGQSNKFYIRPQSMPYGASPCKVVVDAFEA